MNENNLTFSDLFEEVKLEIFKYLNLKERISCAYVSREWYIILSRLSILQETLVIGQPEFDSTDRMKLSLCNINSRHVVKSFHTIDTNDLIRNSTEDVAIVVSRLLKTFTKLRSIFIYDPVPIKLSDLPDTIEHIHFGHNTKNVIAFDKTNFPKLTCISTIDAHLDEHYLDGLTNLLKAQKLQLENVSVCEVPRSLSEQLIEMQNLKQLYVFDFKSDFDALYKERNLEIMDAHPKLQYFNMFSYFWKEAECPTDMIKWLVELGSTNKPLDKQFVIDVFEVGPLVDTFEFAKDFIHGLYLTFNSDFDTRLYKAKLNTLKHVRLTCEVWPIVTENVQSSLQHIFDIAPNLQNLHLRFLTKEIFEDRVWIDTILNEVYQFARKNPTRPMVFELSALGIKPDTSFLNPHLPRNLSVIFNSLR